MKKIIWMAVIISLLSGCSSGEQGSKILEFWTKQLAEVQQQVLTKQMANRELPAEWQAALEKKKAVPAPAAQGAKKAAESQPVEQVYQPIKAQLFLSDTCPWCQKLKNSGFPTKFKNKYAEEVDLKIYEVNSKEGNREFYKAVKKYNLRGGVPLMIIGSSVIPGYSDNMMEIADEKVRIELKKRPMHEVPAGPAVVSITMEDDVIAGPAPEQDKEQMKIYLDKVREENEETLNTVRNTLSRAAWRETLTLITQTENKLKQIANKSTSYADFRKKSAVVEQQHQQQIEDLFRKNVNKKR